MAGDPISPIRDTEMYRMLREAGASKVKAARIADAQAGWMARDSGDEELCVVERGMRTDRDELIAMIPGM